MTASDTTAVGIDIGGTGIKAAVIDVSTGALLSKRVKTPTPPGGEPQDILAAAAALVRSLPSTDSPVGVAFPSVVKNGHTFTASNVSDSWVGLPAEQIFAEQLDRPVVLMNDADAAGLAEQRYGAARGQSGLVLVTTLGTGIGTAFVYNGVLQPNVELGHLQWQGGSAEQQLSARARERRDLPWDEWGRELTGLYRHMERLFSPELFIISGGVSKRPELFLPYIDIATPIAIATLANNAGIIGAAALAADSA